MTPDSTLRNKITDAIVKVRSEAAAQHRVASTESLVNAAMEQLPKAESPKERK